MICDMRSLELLDKFTEREVLTERIFHCSQCANGWRERTCPIHVYIVALLGAKWQHRVLQSAEKRLTIARPPDVSPVFPM